MDYIKKIFQNKDLRDKIFFVLAMFAIFRVATAIPVPGINEDALRKFFEGNQFFGLLNIFSGGGLSNLSIAMLGVGPYITASIIMQLLTMVFPKLKEMYMEDERSRAKFNQYTRISAIPLAALQGYGLLVLLQNRGVLPQLGWADLITNIIVVVAGTTFLMWIGELITEKGIGEGVSLIIFAGIVAGMPQTIGQTIADYDPSKIPTYIALLVIAVAVVAGVVMLNEAQRNVPVSYAKRVRGSKMYGGVSTYLPLKINQAGVIPIIFAISILLLPGMFAQFVSVMKISWLSRFALSFNNFVQNPWIFDSAYFFLVVVFTYFYTAVTFDPQNISENLQKNGGFIPGIRPGANTAGFLHKITNRITLAGAICLGLIAILPFLIQSGTGVGTMSIGGTSLLIVVAVALDSMKQIKAQVSMVEYD